MNSHSRKNAVAVLLILLSTSAQALAPARPQPKPVQPPNDKSWVAVHVFDSVYPMTGEQTFPETEASIEIINQLFQKRKAFRGLARTLGFNVGKLGERTDMGHYLIWIHLSDDFISHHPEIDKQVDPYMFAFAGRKTDIFTAWSGSVNISAFLTKGVRGLAEPIRDANGKLQGNYQNFVKDIVPLGDADYEGGWYMNTDQAEKILTSFHSYKGTTEGYSFMRTGAERPNLPYDPANAQLVNGYNCGDFVFYALNTAGIVPKEVSESLKISFWYPKIYFDRALPLMGVGQKAANWLGQHPDQTSLPDSTMIGMAWPELLFGTRGLELFDKRKMVEEIWQYHYPLTSGRIWDQAHAIAWLKTHAEFRSKGIYTEIYQAVKNDIPIVSPVRTVPETKSNHFVKSNEFARMTQSGNRFQGRKYKDADLVGMPGKDFRYFYETLKSQ